MSKKHDKRDKKRGGPPTMSPAAVLRPRLDALWANPGWPQGDEASLSAVAIRNHLGAGSRGETD